MSARPDLGCRFFTDRDLGRMIWRAMLAAGADVVAHDDVFPDQSTPDVEWIRYAAREDRLVLTRNKHIRWTPDEFDCVMTTGARLLVLVGRKVSHPQWASALSGDLPRLERFARRHAGPYFAKVYHRPPGIECDLWVTA